MTDAEAPQGDRAPVDPRDRVMIDEALRQVQQAEEAARLPTDTSPGGPHNRHQDLPSEELPKDLIPGHELIREIHRGGQGVVYQAIQVATKRKVAIKVMHEGPHAGPAARERFKREIQLIATLDHPNIVKVVDSGINQGRYYYAMDYINGQPLDKYVESSGLSNEQIIRTFTKICDAIDFAHRQGIVHRDLKPSNILVDRRGEPHLVDFGMAKVAAGGVGGSDQPVLISITGQIVGTLPYMSPEQARGGMEEVDARTDVYSLGVILYQLLTGRFPYEVIGNMRDVLDNILRAEPKRPSTIRRSLNNDLETIVLKALSKEPVRRYQSAADLGRDLGHFLAWEAIEAKRDSGWYVLRKHIGRHRRSISVFTTLLFVVTIAIIVIVSNRRSVREKIQGLEATTRQASTTIAGLSTQNVGLEKKLAQKTQQEADLRRRLKSGVSPEDDLSPASYSEQLPSDSTRINRNASVRLLCNAPVRTLNPFRMTNESEVLACDLVFERLYVPDKNLSLIPNPNVGSIEVVDGRTRKLHLRNGLKWHDSQPVTAEDVIFSWQCGCSDQVGDPNIEYFQLLESVSAENLITVVFNYPTIEFTPVESLSFPLIPRHVYEKWLHAGDNADEFRSFSKNPIGSGWFRVERLNTEQLSLARFEDADSTPAIRRLTIRWMEHGQTSLDDILSSDERVDICSITQENYIGRRKDDDVRAWGVLCYPKDLAGPVQFILWNCTKGCVFSDRAVRLATAHAIDRERIISEVTNGVGLSAIGLVPIDSPNRDVTVQALTYDPQEAKQILDSAGWSRAQDGWRYREGNTSALSFSIIALKEGPNSRRTAWILKESLEKIGIRVNVTILDQNEYSHALANGKFEAIISAFLPTIDPSAWKDYFETGAHNNLGKYSNPELDQIFDSLTNPESRLNGRARSEYILKMQRIIQDDQPITILYSLPTPWAISHRLRGVEFSIRGPFLFYPGIRNWWVPTDSQ